MRRRCTTSAVAVCVGAAGALLLASPLFATSPVSAAQQKKFLSLDAVFAKAAAAFTSGVEKMPTTVSTATFDKTIAKPAAAYATAISGFDSGLAALGLPGTAGSDAATVIKDNKQLQVVLEASAKDSVSTFQKAFGQIFAEMGGPLEENFRTALGLPASDAIQI